MVDRFAKPWHLISAGGFPRHSKKSNRVITIGFRKRANKNRLANRGNGGEPLAMYKVGKTFSPKYDVETSKGNYPAGPRADRNEKDRPSSAPYKGQAGKGEYNGWKVMQPFHV